MQNVCVGVWLKLVAVAFVEFVLEFYPVETDRVQEAFQLVHQHKDAECHSPENGPEYDALYYKMVKIYILT